MKEQQKYINPYLGGFLLGLVLLAAFYLSGRGLGASGAMKSTIVAAVQSVNPEKADEHAYYSMYTTENKNPMNSWLVYEVLGVLIGGFLSGIFSGRTKFRTDHGPGITKNKRLIFALLGGILFGLGSQIGLGCTSGAALSGMAVLSTAGFISMLAIFGGGYIFAYFFRKLWI